MEPGSSEKEMISAGGHRYKVLWHPEIKDDFVKIPINLRESIVQAAEHRLSAAPQFIGQPLKGTTNLIWKISFSKYRILYTMNAKCKEVWILSVQKREIVYRHQHVLSLLKLAISLQEQIEKDD